jgi:hypothetical protein
MIILREGTNLESKYTQQGEASDSAELKKNPEYSPD